MYRYRANGFRFNGWLVEWMDGWGRKLRQRKFNWNNIESRQNPKWNGFRPSNSVQQTNKKTVSQCISSYIYTFHLISPLGSPPPTTHTAHIRVPRTNNCWTVLFSVRHNKASSCVLVLWPYAREWWCCRWVHSMSPIYYSASIWNITPTYILHSTHIPLAISKNIPNAWGHPFPLPGVGRWRWCWAVSHKKTTPKASVGTLLVEHGCHCGSSSYILPPIQAAGASFTYYPHPTPPLNPNSFRSIFLHHRSTVVQPVQATYHLARALRLNTRMWKYLLWCHWKFMLLTDRYSFDGVWWRACALFGRLYCLHE